MIESVQMYDCLPGTYSYYSFLLQYSRNVSQSRWIIDDERMGEASVEVLQDSSFNGSFLVICGCYCYVIN